MNSFYQELQDNEKVINYNLGPYFTFPPHFHQKIEIFFLIRGEFGVWLNGTPFKVKSGDIMFFDSYSVHAYDKLNGDVEGLVIIVPPNFAQKFFARKGAKKVINPLISNPELCEKLYDLSKKFVVDQSVPDTVKSGAVELVLALLERELSFVENQNNDETTLAQSLLTYINQNYRKRISLSLLAKEFGYSPEHISRVFHRYLNSGLPDFVNNLRLDFVNTVIKNGEKVNITDLLFNAGFNSIQSYYRAKRKREKQG